MPDSIGRICICNTSPLFYLHQIKRLTLLEDLYGSVVTTPEVQEELAAGADGGEDVPDLRHYDWLVAIGDTQIVSLYFGKDQFRLLPLCVALYAERSWKHANCTDQGRRSGLLSRNQ